MLKREDFLNLTICTSALFMMFNTDRISRGLFRILVLGIFISLIFDLTWFFIKHSEFAEDQKVDGGMETNLRKIVLMLSYASFLLRVIYFIIIHIIDICSACVLERFNGLCQDYLEQRTYSNNNYRKKVGNQK
jgi:hypothetical protein